MDKSTISLPIVPDAVEETPSDPAPQAAPTERSSRLKTLRSVLGLVGVLMILVFFIAFVAGVPLPGISPAFHEETAAAPPPLGVHRVTEVPHTLLVPEDVRIALGIRKDGKERIVAAKLPDIATTRPLVLSGSTDLDPTRVMHIRARFAPAEVSEIGKLPDPHRRGKSGETIERQLRAGDWVKKGDVLGVFNSEVVGQKKNDLIDALVSLDVDERFLKNARERSAAASEAMLMTFQKSVDTDRNLIARHVATLKIWGIPKEDIDAVYKEAEEIGKRKGKRDKTKEYVWSRVELKAPDDGVIVERNVTERDIVQDPTVNLFQIAKVDRLLVKANAPEDDLPTLLKLPPELRTWSVRPLAEQRGGIVPAEGIQSPIDDISYIIDVNQHNAVVKGHIDNPVGKDGLPVLRGGQFVSCVIRLPPPENVVEIPMSAIVDDGRQCIVFVQPDADKPVFTMRRVKILQRFEKTAFVRSTLTAKEQEHTPEDQDFELLPPRPLRKGEQVLVTGALELKRELEDRESKGEQQ